jgi:hypothetical protein
MFRSWHNTLFLGPMPGTEDPLQEWFDELDKAEDNCDRLPQS